jgi:DNA polymerase-3 subunit gamma/tau
MLQINYRPNNFDDFLGNVSTVKSLQSKLKQKALPQSILFQGPSGCGKTTLARILMKELGCDQKDYIEINAATESGIDTVRGIVKNINLRPMFGKVRIYLLDEVQATSKGFQNGLLKPLEDMPSFVYFILCTTDPQKLLKTIRNRCTTYEVDLLSDKDMQGLIERVFTAEEKPIDEEVVFDIIEVADGCPRQALVILDQIIDMDPRRQRRAVRDYVTNEAKTIELCRALLNKQSWPNIQTILADLTDDAEKVRRAVIGYMSAVAIKERNPQVVNQAEKVYHNFKLNYFDTGKAGLVFSCWSAVKDEDIHR